MSLQTRILTDPNYFSTAAGEWHDLLSRSQTRPFFMEPSYQQSWWQHLGHGELAIIEVRNETQLVGLLPLFKDEVAGENVWRIVGAVEESDYLDAVVDAQFLNPVYAELIQGLTQLSATRVWLESIQPESATFTILASMLQAQGWSVSQEQQDVTPKLALPKSMAEYYTLLDSKVAKNLQRQVRAIGEDDEIRYECLTTAADVKDQVSTFIKLHQASSQEKASFWTPAREVFFHDMTVAVAAAGYLRLYVCYVNHDPGAMILVFDYLNQFLGYNSGFNAYRYGHMGISNVLSMYVTEDAINLGRSTLDFMRGDEAYKYQMGAKAEPLLDLKLNLNPDD